MPFKDKEKQREYQRAWRKKNPDKQGAYEKKYNEAHPGRRKEIERRYALAHPDRLAERARRRRATNPESCNSAARRWAETHPEETRVAWKLHAWVRRGHLDRPEQCSICGKTCHPHGHHDNYSKPYDVIWVCAKCHREIHGEKNERLREPGTQESLPRPTAGVD